jgi:hypothetical protein
MELRYLQDGTGVCRQTLSDGSQSGDYALFTRRDHGRTGGPRAV